MEKVLDHGDKGFLVRWDKSVVAKEDMKEVEELGGIFSISFTSLSRNFITITWADSWVKMDAFIEDRKACPALVLYLDGKSVSVGVGEIERHKVRLEYGLGTGTLFYLRLGRKYEFCPFDNSVDGMSWSFLATGEVLDPVMAESKTGDECGCTRGACARINIHCMTCFGLFCGNHYEFHVSVVCAPYTTSKLFPERHKNFVLCECCKYDCLGHTIDFDAHAKILAKLAEHDAAKKKANAELEKYEPYNKVFATHVEVGLELFIKGVYSEKTAKAVKKNLENDRAYLSKWWKENVDNTVGPPLGIMGKWKSVSCTSMGKGTATIVLGFQSATPFEGTKDDLRALKKDVTKWFSDNVLPRLEDKNMPVLKIMSPKCFCNFSSMKPVEWVVIHANK